MSLLISFHKNQQCRVLFGVNLFYYLNEKINGNAFALVTLVTVQAYAVCSMGSHTHFLASIRQVASLL